MCGGGGGGKVHFTIIWPRKEGHPPSLLGDYIPDESIQSLNIHANFDKENLIQFYTSFLIYIIFLCILIPKKIFADSHNYEEIIKIIQQDLKTLEKAVYSNSQNEILNESITELDQSSEEVLTRHLLKLSEIEKQFQELTNRFEEINFKLDKLSNRLSKVQSDNQMRFQQLETLSVGENNNKKISSSSDKKKILPGSKKFIINYLKFYTKDISDQECRGR